MYSFTCSPRGLEYPLSSREIIKPHLCSTLRERYYPWERAHIVELSSNPLIRLKALWWSYQFPIISPNPITDRWFIELLEAEDMPSDMAFKKDRFLDNGVVSHDLRPMCIEGVPVGRILGCEGSHSIGDRVYLVLEKCGQVMLYNIARQDGRIFLFMAVCFHPYSLNMITKFLSLMTRIDGFGE